MIASDFALSITLLSKKNVTDTGPCTTQLAQQLHQKEHSIAAHKQTTKTNRSIPPLLYVFM